MAQVLLVRKVPLLRRLADEDLARLVAGGVVQRERLEASAAMQDETLAAVRAALAGDQVIERPVHESQPEDGAGIDLVVTVGGDGTVFAAGNLITTAPYLTVNSDPERSVGHFTRWSRLNVAEAVDAWHSGKAWLEAIPRLEVTVENGRWFVLNDALFTSTNPAAMSRYLLEVTPGPDGLREFQRSSGVWVATAAGSTAAIRSAGASPVPAGESALLWRVREAFPANAGYRLLEGCQRPPLGLRLVPAVPGMALYLDGPNLTVPLPPGTAARFSLADMPLRLLR